jgi:serine/threonine protein kinase
LRDQFAREVQLATKIRHRSLASVYPLELVEDSYLYAMEFCDGETLDDCITRSGKLETLVALNIGTQIAAGLDVASSAGLLHRNITANNILLLQEDDEISVKVLGLALPCRSIAESNTGPSTDCDFRSPEEVAGKPIDVRSGIYSVGALLYYTEAGPEKYALFRAKSLANQQDVFGDAGDFSPRIAVIAKHTLPHDPKERIATFAELRDVIGGALTAPKQSPIDVAALPVGTEKAVVTPASPPADLVRELDVSSTPPTETAPKAAGLATGKLVIPAKLLGVAQAGTVLRLKRVGEGPREKVVACVGTTFRIGRATNTDLVTRFPRSKVNDLKSKRLSKVHATVKCEGDQVLLSDGNGVKPSANGSTFELKALTVERPIALVKPGELRLADAYSIKVHPLLVGKNDPPAIANLSQWSGPKVESKPPLAGAILFMPITPFEANLVLWLFSVIEFGSSSESALDFALPADEQKIGALRSYRGCFWLEHRSGDSLLVDGLALAKDEIAPLVTGQTVEINGSKYSVEIEHLSNIQRT